MYKEIVRRSIEKCSGRFLWGDKGEFLRKIKQSPENTPGGIPLHPGGVVEILLNAGFGGYSVTPSWYLLYVSNNELRSQS